MIRLFILLTLFASPAFAAGEVGVIAWLNNILELFKVTGKTAVGFAFLMGIIFFILFFLAVKRLNKQGQDPVTVGSLVTTFIAGIGCFYLGAMLVAGGETIMGNSDGVANSVTEADFGL